MLGPLLSGWGGLSAIFGVTLLLAVCGVAIVRWWTPPEPALPVAGQTKHSLWGLLVHPDLIRLNFGVFALYAVQLASWVAIPALLVQAGVVSTNHGYVYLPAVLLSFVFMGMTLFPMERKGQLRPLFLACIALVLAVQAAWGWMAWTAEPELWLLAMLLFFFFCGFNVLEASQPSLASRLAPAGSRGAALGVYNTLQSLGIFAGGAFGGWLVKRGGAHGVLCTRANDHPQTSLDQAFNAGHALLIAEQGPVAHGATINHARHTGTDQFFAFSDQGIKVRCAVWFARRHQRRHHSGKNILAHGSRPHSCLPRCMVQQGRRKRGLNGRANLAQIGDHR